MSENRHFDFASSEHPLLVMLKERAPGTYKHSLSVAEICVNIASELGLDKDKMRIAALYHDVGKAIFETSSRFFTENQTEDLGQSPHEVISEELSFSIISRHPSDSVLLLSRYDFPNDILNIVGNHHGNFVIVYFWRKAGGKEEDKKRFRYPGVPPQDVYTGILMAVDRIESAAKSLYSSGKMKDSKSRIKLINDIFEELVDDDQLDNLTIKDSKVIKKVLKAELSALYHDRIDYDEKLKEKEEKVNDECEGKE